MSRRVGHCHIHFGPIQTSRGASFRARVAYQERTQISAMDTPNVQTINDWIDGCVLLPVGAFDAFADRSYVIDEIERSEKRVDAQQGFELEFALNTIVPHEMALPIAAFVLAPLIDRGMIAVVDAHDCAATDGGRNLHIHAALSQRYLNGDRFGKKARVWNTLFRDSEGRRLRHQVAASLNQIYSLLGFDGAFSDPRSNAERDRLPPEGRLPSRWFQQFRAGQKVAGLEDLQNSRRRRAKAQDRVDQVKTDMLAALNSQPEAKMAANGLRQMRLPFGVRAVSKPTAVIANSIIQRRIETAPFCPSSESADRAESLAQALHDIRFSGDDQMLTLGMGHSEVSITNGAFVFGGDLDRLFINAVLDVADDLHWPSIELTGDDAFTDMVARLAAVKRHGPVVVDRYVSHGVDMPMQTAGLDACREVCEAFDRSGRLTSRLVVLLDAIARAEEQDFTPYDPVHVFEALTFPDPDVASTSGSTINQNSTERATRADLIGAKLDKLLTEFFEPGALPAIKTAMPDQPTSVKVLTAKHGAAFRKKQ
jgi:hypothetical protein